METAWEGHCRERYWVLWEHVTVLGDFLKAVTSKLTFIRESVTKDLPD